MNKINLLFTFCFLWIASTQLVAQDPTVSFSFAPSAIAANVGDEIDVDVVVGDGFDNLIGLQFGINYNGAALEYLGITGTNPLGSDYSVAKRPNKSELINVWAFFNLGSVDLAPGTVLYTMQFRVLSDIGNSIDINCGPGEVGCEFSNENLEKFEDIVVDQTGDINGGGPSANVGPININIGNEQAATGSEACVQFVVGDFVDILSAQFSIQYDETVLSFSSILQDATNCPGSGSAVSNPLCLVASENFNLFEPGTLTFSFSDFQNFEPFTLNDGTVIIDLCFDVIGAGGTSSDITIDGEPTFIQVIKNGEGNENFGINSTVGSITVTGSGGSLDVVSYSIGNAGGDTGTNVCVPVTVNSGFTDILGFGWSIDYDASILDYTGIQNVNSNISTLGVNETSPSNLSFIWNAPFVGNSQVSLADETVLYEMCFDVIGNSGQMSPLTFSNTPNPIETVKIDGPDPDTDPDLTIVDAIDGNVTVTNSDGFNLIICEVDACPADQVCVPILATGATEIASLSFTLAYDPAVLSYTDFDAVANIRVNEPGNNIGNINIIYISFANPPQDLNLEDCEQLGEFCFDVIGAQGTSSTVAITSDPTEFQASIVGLDGFPEEIEVGSTNGVINVDCGGTPGAPIITCACGAGDLNIDEASTVVNDVVCNGEQNGSIVLSVEGGETPLTYSWSNGATTKDISDLGPGNFMVDITDNGGVMVSASFTVAEPQVLQPNSTANNTTTGSSNDGSISLSVTGGVEPYTYLWGGGEITPTITGLAPDSYNVTITDANGCIVLTSRTIGTNLTIGQSGGPGSAAGITIITDVACFGENTGSIDLALSGGVPPFNINWSTSSTQEDLSDLAAGNYCVIVIDTNGESVDQCFDVTGPASSLDIIVVGLSPQTLPGANDGAIDINVVGGGSSYSYNWNGPGVNNVTTQDISGLAEGNYTVNVTDDLGCVRSSTFFVETAGEALSINSGASQVNDVVCFGDDNGSINPAVNGGTTPYAFAWSGPNMFSASTGNISSLAPGSYQLTVTDAEGMTAESVLFLISQPASPINATAQITSESSPGMNDGGVELTVSGGTPGYSFAWNNNRFTEDNFALTMGTYTVTITDARGCTFIESYVVPVDADPLVIDALGSTVNNVRCFGDANGSISAVVNGGVPPYNFDWGFSTDSTISGLLAGQYTLTVTDQGGQTAIQTFLVGTPSQLEITINSSSPETANGNDGSISITVSGGTPTYVYSWSGPNGFSSTAEDITNLSEGLYTITTIDANGCSVQRPILLGAILSIENKFETDVNCFGECTGEIDIIVVGGQPPYLYDWDGPDSFTASTQDINDLCAGIYSATITDAAGQNVFTTCRVDEPLLALSIASNPTIINEVVPSNGSINITVNGGTPGYTYQWSNQATSEDITNLEAGSYKVTITDNNGCIVISPDYVVERIPLTLNIEMLTENDPTCAGDCNGSVSLQIQGGDAPYTLDWSDIGTLTLSTTNPFYTRNEICAGEYTLNITDANGQSVALQIELEDLAAIEVPAVVMAETTGMDGSINTSVTGGQAPYNYNWAPSGLPSTPDQENLTAGLYIVTVTDANSCTAIESFVIENNIGPLTIAPNPVITQINCFGDMNGTIDISVSGGAMPYTFLWSSIPTQNTEDAIGLGAGSYTVTITDANGIQLIGGPYVINEPSELTATVLNVSGPTGADCDGEAIVNPMGGQAPYTFLWESGEVSDVAEMLCEGTQNVTVFDALGCTEIVEFVAEDQFVPLSSDVTISPVDCNGNATGSINLNVAGGFAPYTYLWNSGDTTPFIGSLLPGVYSCTITDLQGNITVAGPFTITEPDAIVINFNVTPESGILTGDGAAEAIVSGGVAPYTYQWNNSTGHNTFDCTDLTAATYFVVVQDANECIAVDSVVVTNSFGGECMQTRNIITPSEDDGKNDSFLIQCAPGSINTLEIYNRFGQLVFLMENYDNSWEGTDRRGNLLPAGGYFYVFILEDPTTGESVPFKGHITILK